MNQRKKFYAHQLEAFKYCREEKHPALFMEMRLGKTLVTIRRCKMYRPLDSVFGLRILVVAPNSALGSWEEELHGEGEGDKICWLRGTKNTRLKRLWHEDARWYLINREGFLALPELAEKDIVNWDAVILDESTFIKNWDAKVTQFFVKNFRDCPHRWILTGTPNPESDLEYYPQLNFLDGGAFGCSGFYQFRSVFFNSSQSGGWIPVKEMEPKIAQYVGNRCFIMRRKDVNLDAKKIFETRKIKLPQKIRDSYDLVEEEFRLPDGTETIWTFVQYQWLRQLCGGFIEKELVWNGKIKELCSLLQGELAKESVVVWFNYRAELHAVEKALKRRKISFTSIHGGIKSGEPRELRRKYFMDGHCRVALMQQQIAQTGMNLSVSDTAIYFSEPVGSFARMQTEDRILSLQKKAPLLYICLVVEDTVDEDLHYTLKAKKWKSDKSLSDALMVRMRKRRNAKQTNKEVVQ